jgi:hypothetical protein
MLKQGSLELNVRKTIRLAPILLDEIEKSVSCLISIIYDISEEERAAEPNDLSKANLTGKKLVNESPLKNASREIQEKELLKKLFKESTRERGQSIKKNLFDEPSESEPIKLVN